MGGKTEKRIKKTTLSAIDVSKNTELSAMQGVQEGNANDAQRMIAETGLVTRALFTPGGLGGPGQPRNLAAQYAVMDGICPPAVFWQGVWDRMQEDRKAGVWHNLWARKRYADVPTLSELDVRVATVHLTASDVLAAREIIEAERTALLSGNANEGVIDAEARAISTDVRET